MMKRITLALTVAALMAGCSSGVKLDDVPVEDKNATSTMGGANNGANSGNTSQSGVAGVDLGQSGRDGAGPVGVARVVYFDYDSYVIKPEFQSMIEAHSRFIKAAPNRKVMIEGHTDDRGTREYNLALGDRRANAAKNYLVARGVSPSRITTISYGKERPLALGSDEESWAQNRRAVTVVLN